MRVIFFEPLIGSKHVQLGLGFDGEVAVRDTERGSLTLLGELKWRYGLKGCEYRTFDLTKNGEWSRYMLVVQESDPSTTLFATNFLTLQTDVTPKNSLDLYLAAHWQSCNWQFELGYDFWYRSAEKICLSKTASLPTSIGIADLVGIAALDPETASTANITQGVQPGINQMVSDTTFITIKPEDLNLCSAGAPCSLSNTVYGSIGYTFEYGCHEMQVGLNVAYERGVNVNVPDNASVWLNVDYMF